jgi:PKD repeat protein
MKTLKHTLLLLVMLASLSNLKAQCWNYSQAYTNGANAQFYSWIDSNSIATATYYWDFGDGDTANAIQTSHTYAQSGNYLACFHYASTGCTIDTCLNLVIDLCDFDPQPTYTVNNLTASFAVANAQTGATYSWTINSNDGSYTYPSSSATPQVTLPDYGYYTASVQVTLLNGCVDSGVVWLNVINPCTASFFYGMSDSLTAQFYPNPYDSVNTPSQFTYAWTFGDGNSSSGYSPSNMYAAYGTYNVCVTVTGTGCTDTYCQDISVSPPPPPTYHIYGQINKGASHACASTVYLIKDSIGFLSVFDATRTIDSGGLNCNGYYAFYGMPQGTYYVKAALDSADVDYDNYLPTYYGNELNWTNATAVILNSMQYNIDINLTAGVNPGGPGFVGGWVTQGAGLAIGGDNISRAAGDPLPNVQINLLTDNDVPVASTYTDANGRYTFSNLAIGTYKIYAEQINKVPYSLNVTLTANNPTQDDVNVTVNSNTAVTGLENLNGIHVEGISPNPVTDRTIVSISLNQNSKVQLTVTDVNGRLLENRNLDLNSGNNSINLTLSDEPAGIYHLSLTNGAEKRILKLVKVN